MDVVIIRWGGVAVVDKVAQTADGVAAVVEATEQGGGADAVGEAAKTADLSPPWTCLLSTVEGMPPGRRPWGQ